MAGKSFRIGGALHHCNRLEPQVGGATVGEIVIMIIIGIVIVNVRIRVIVIVILIIIVIGIGIGIELIIIIVILSLRASRRPGPRVHPSLLKGF